MNSVTSHHETNGHEEDTQILVGRGVEAIEQTARVNRKRFLWTWALLGGLAFMLSLALFLSIDTAADQNDLAREQSDLAKKQAQTAQDTSNQTLAYLRGEQGIPGVPGSSGVEGTPGLPGSQGEKGPEGPPGPKGDTGASGAVGAVGTVGAQGQPGTQGQSGAAGEAGATGEAGAKGATGAKGEKGEKGDTGAQGAQGPVGPQGPQGKSGLTNLVAAFAVSATNPDDVKSANAVCPPGSTVVSGGYILQAPASVNITVSATGNNGWLINAVETVPVETDWSVQAVALCTPAVVTPL